MVPDFHPRVSMVGDLTRSALQKRLFALLAGVLCLSSTGLLAQEWVYTVRPGDNLWRLSERYLQSHEDWPKLQELNQIKDPQALQPGQQLRIPVAWLKHQPQPARIIALVGEATITTADGAVRAAASGAELFSGDNLVTAPGGSLSIEFADGSRMLVSAETELLMDALGAFQESGMVDTSVRVRKGRVENQVMPQKPTSRYRIITPAAVAAVRGTAFRVSADEQGAAMRSEVVEGKISVSAVGVSVAVPAGFATVAEAGKPPMSPRQLPMAPDLGGLRNRFAQSEVSFLWVPVNGAVAYRAQLAGDAAFNILFQEHVGAAPQVTWQDLTPGEYVMRVRAIDDLKIEGLDADHNFVVLAPPAAPRLTTPKQDAVISHGQPWLAWSHAPDANSYRIQIAADAEFQTQLQTIESIVNTNYTPLQPLAPGRYYWRAAKTMGTIVSDYSEPRSFVITTVPAAPGEPQYELDGPRITFSWGVVAGAGEYQFQLAGDREFQQIKLDSTVQEPVLSVEQSAAGALYYRVRAVNQHGVAGPYSTIMNVITQE